MKIQKTLIQNLMPRKSGTKPEIDKRLHRCKPKIGAPEEIKPGTGKQD